jgi:CspA family cold shock protein
MTNHGRGRQSRRRGFDDDFSFDRPTPGADRAPYAPSGGGRPAAPAGFGPEVGATVKWFNSEKGFGFVELSDGSGDVFLHVNSLSNAGHTTVSPGATLRVRVGQGQKGRQVSEVLSVDESTATPEASRSRGPEGHGGPGGAGGGARPPRRGPDLSTAVEMRGTVKMYNATKGFGFVAVPTGGKDVFVHASALQRSGLTQLTEGQTVSMDVVQGTKGPEAAAVRLD